jgi:hypothetical protein
MRSFFMKLLLIAVLGATVFPCDVGAQPPPPEPPVVPREAAPPPLPPPSPPAIYVAPPIAAAPTAPCPPRRHPLRRLRQRIRCLFGCGAPE